MATSIRIGQVPQCEGKVSLAAARCALPCRCARFSSLMQLILRRNIELADRWISLS